MFSIHLLEKEFKCSQPLNHLKGTMALGQFWSTITRLMFCSMFYCFKLKSKKYIERLIDLKTLSEINHGQRRHLWTPTDFRHHQSDIWNDENGLGIEFVTIVVWFGIRLSFNGNENQSTWDTESISIRTNVLAAATFTFRCEKSIWGCCAANTDPL